MAGGKQPYIPLYIGDWEQDVNCLSIEAEGAWLKIIFKCWKNKDKGTFTTNVDSVCRLWKVDRLKFAAILLELKSNDVGQITEGSNESIVFLSPRIVRDHQISTLRKVSGSKGGSKTKAKQAANQQAIFEQKPDIDNESESDIGFNEIGEKSEIWIGVRAKYLNEKPRRIYDLAMYFDGTGQGAVFRVNGWDKKYEAFMISNPAAVFNDENHLYSTFKRFSVEKSESGKRKVAFTL